MSDTAAPATAIPADAGPAPAPARWGRFHLPWRTGEDWERPGPTRDQLRRDAVGTAILIVISALMLEVARGFGGLAGETRPVWLQHLALALMILPLALRRRYPLAVMLVSSALFVALALLVPAVGIQISFQAAYFASLYTAVAWARDRRLLWMGTTVVLAAMALWVIMALTVSNSYDTLITEVEQGDSTYRGVLPPLASYAIYNAVVNAAYFGGAIAFGLSSWRSAHQREQLMEQSAKLERQGRELARQAVVDERLRIARELHDVVAHHIAVIGVHAGGARRVLGRKPDQAADALLTIESSSREAVNEMRALLGVLRSTDELYPEPDADGKSHRRPEPGLDDLNGLVAEHRDNGLRIDFQQVEDEPGALKLVPAPLALSIYRTAQESLSNIRRHSTASSAVLTLRTGSSEGRRWVEVETVDDGRPRPLAEPGSGFGLRGIRERAALHSGTADIGPRQGTGWRVRVRFQLR